MANGMEQSALDYHMGNAIPFAAVRLGAYLREQRLTEEAFAELVQTDQGSINRARRGIRASLQLAISIERATNGTVRAEELPLTKSSRRALRALRATELSSKPVSPSEAQGATEPAA